MAWKKGVLGVRLDKEIGEEMKAAGVAKRAGISESMLSRYRTGKTEPGAKAIFRLALAVGVSADYLLGLTDEPRSRHAEPAASPPAPKGRYLEDRVAKLEARLDELHPDGVAKLTVASIGQGTGRIRHGAEHVRGRRSKQ